MRGSRGQSRRASGRSRGGFRGRGDYRGRGRGFLSQMHIHNDDSSLTALQIAESHQCNNLSFETRDPATIHSRVYVGNICRDKVSRPDLFVIFSKYGTITAISHLTSRSINDHCSFAFVQYTTKEAAEKATSIENGQGYYGYSLDVKLAEFRAENLAASRVESSNGEPTLIPVVANSSSSAQSAPVSAAFNKRAAASSHLKSAPSPKRSRIEQPGGPPDILVCGLCHMVFSGIEAMIEHKRNPCKSLGKCRCAEEKVPELLTCAICLKQLATPWQLINHTHRVHAIVICSNLAALDGDGSAAQEDAVGEEYDEAVDPALVDLDNDLMEEELEEGLI